MNLCVFIGPENNTALVYLKTENIIWLFDKLKIKRKGILSQRFTCIIFSNLRGPTEWLQTCVSALSLAAVIANTEQHSYGS